MTLGIKSGALDKNKLVRFTKWSEKQLEKIYEAIVYPLQ